MEKPPKPEFGADRVASDRDVGLGGGLDQAEEAQLGITDEELKKRIREQQVTRILAVLSGVANDARNWTDAAAASKVQAQIADVIWDADSDIARGYLIREFLTEKFA